MKENQIVIAQRGDIYYMPDKDNHGDEQTKSHPYMVISASEPEAGQKVICVSLTSTLVENARYFIPIKFGKYQSWINPHTPYSYMLSEFKYDNYRGHCADKEILELVTNILVSRFGVDTVNVDKYDKYCGWFNDTFPDLPEYISNTKQSRMLDNLVYTTPAISEKHTDEESQTITKPVSKPKIVTLGLSSKITDWDDGNLIDFFDMFRKDGCIQTSTKYHMSIAECADKIQEAGNELVTRGLKTKDEVSSFRKLS